MNPVNPVNPATPRPLSRPRTSDRCEQRARSIAARSTTAQSATARSTTAQSTGPVAPVAGRLLTGRLVAIRRSAATWVYAVLATLVSSVSAPPTRRRPASARPAGQAGQSTVEYALILLGAAAVALVVVAWVTRTDLIGRLFDTVVGRILQQAS